MDIVYYLTNNFYSIEAIVYNRLTPLMFLIFCTSLRSIPILFSVSSIYLCRTRSNAFSKSIKQTNRSGCLSLHLCARTWMETIPLLFAIFFWIWTAHLLLLYHTFDIFYFVQFLEALEYCLLNDIRCMMLTTLFWQLK